MRLFRLTLARYAETALSGEGSRRVGGRWTPAGHLAVYTSSSIALAVLETLVNAPASVMPAHCVIALDLPDDLKISKIDIARLPRNWQRTPPPADLANRGRAWLEKAESCVLRVPSSLVPQEFNYILNPVHPDFDLIQVGEAVPFQINPRLVDG